MRRVRGFTLLEALILLSVLSIGLLGAARLLLDSLDQQRLAGRRVQAMALVTDMAAQIRANLEGGAHHDSRRAASSGAVCAESCDAAALAERSLADFRARAETALAGHAPQPQVFFEPAIGPAPARFLVSLRWQETRNPALPDEIRVIVVAQLPVAGGAG